ncbi:hypothetical protein AKJ16_DCAP19481 [Drosera capensis]
MPKITNGLKKKKSNYLRISGRINHTQTNHKSGALFCKISQLGCSWKKNPNWNNFPDCYDHGV